MSGAIPLLLYVFMAWTGTVLVFAFYRLAFVVLTSHFASKLESDWQNTGCLRCREFRVCVCVCVCAMRIYGKPRRRIP